MSAPAKQGGSRWGSFLQQAVAGIEQNLDNILSGDDVPQTHVKPATPAAAAKEVAAPAPTRSATPNSNSRLQERLAKAVAVKAAAARNGTQTPISTSPSRAGTPSILSASPRPSIDSTAAAEDEEDKDAAPIKVEERKGKENEAVPRVSGEDTKDNAPAPTAEDAKDDTATAPATNRSLKDKIETNDPRPSADSITSAASRQSLGARQFNDSSNCVLDDNNPRVQQILNDADREEEIHGYIERIDALQAKLNYLAKGSAETARKAAAEAGQGTLQKKLAEKDEQIALLMVEGQKLSKAELKHMTVIKKLRAFSSTIEKDAKLSKEKLERAEKERASLAERVKLLEISNKQTAQNQRRIAQLEKDLEASRSENSKKDDTISDLKKQLKEATSQATQEEVKKLAAEVNEKRSRINDLEEEVSSEKIERELVEEKLKAREKELNAKMEREAERARVVELELKSEIQTLEARLEIMRSRAEEASSGATGDAQAKLLRQIETLQSQYAVASENWQGIESSLTSRVTVLSRERDEASKREAEMRKKAREMTQKAKSTEEETESLHGRIRELSQELSQLQFKISDVQNRAEESEAALKAAKEQFEKEKQNMASEIRQQVEEERRPSGALPTQSPFMSSSSNVNIDTHRAVSEVASFRRGLTAEFLGLQNIQTSRRPTRGVVDTEDYGRRISRTGSKANLYSGPGGERGSIGQATPKRHDSNILLSPIDGLGGDGVRMGSVEDRGMAQDPADYDYFENVASPADATYPSGCVDGLGSVSTTAAGPSVQLVERMSAAVRRLENEKVGMKEELSRLAKQRDEARLTISELMKEVEDKRQDHDKVEELQKEVEGINDRYQTTLEMLGEKSEMVEELKADVGDLKGMYRNLAEEYAKLKK